jgi:hypothetical protein
MILSALTSRLFQKSPRRRAFTLPEVIISFTVLAMVITSAVGILSVVMRTNTENVSSLIANGLAQEGIEAVRFMRDSNTLLGLDFDGTKGQAILPVWGSKLFEKQMGGNKFFTLLSPENLAYDCQKVDLINCLPYTLREIDGDDPEILAAAPETMIYRQEEELSGGQVRFRYFQAGLTEDDIKAIPTSFHRVIRIEPFRYPGSDSYDSLRVNSMVFWTDSFGNLKKVVLTTNLTEWR